VISFAARAVRLILRLYTYPYRKHHKSLSRSIKLKNKKYVPPKGYGYSIISAGGVRVEMLSPPHPSGAVIHFHGGGHTAGMNSMYRAMAEKYSKLCGATVFSIDYKTGSNLVYPSVHDEAFKAYEYISRTLSDSPFAVAGDSFGANIMLSACLKAREKGLPLPRAIVCISPFADMSASGDSYRINCHNDPLYALPRNQSFEEHEKYIRRVSPYCGNTPPKDKFLSPALADLNSFPDMLIICGALETSASDAYMIYNNACAVKVNARLGVYEGMWHDFMYLFPRLKESKKAWNDIAQFIRHHIE